MNIPKRPWQPGRKELELLLQVTASTFERACADLEPLSGFIDHTDEKTFIPIRVNGGFHYELSIRLVDWPGKEFVDDNRDETQDD